MLSRLTRLSVSALKDYDERADKVIFRTDPLYKTAIFIQSYAQHVLRPHIDAESDHKRHFIKVPFINKGIDFIDLQSIFRNKTVENAIPKYFKNTESPIICYKYNKSVRGLIFNYNKVVRDLNIDTNSPDSCDCSSSKFCYAPAGHVITGNFDIIKDKHLRSLLTKGPKYRLPDLIDFDKCRIQIAEAIQSFAKRWCGREHAEPRALSEWKKQIIDIMDKRISFYTSNPDLLPRKPKVSYRDLKSSIQKFHSKYVLVPADKASNNVIII